MTRDEFSTGLVQRLRFVLQKHARCNQPGVFTPPNHVDQVALSAGLQEVADYVWDAMEGPREFSESDPRPVTGWFAPKPPRVVHPPHVQPEMSFTEYDLRFAERIAQFRAKYPEKWAELEEQVKLEMAMPLKFKRDGIPEFMMLVITDRTAEKVRVLKGWPTPMQFLQQKQEHCHESR